MSSRSCRNLQMAITFRQQQHTTEEAHSIYAHKTIKPQVQNKGVP